MHAITNANPTRLGDAFEPRREINVVAKNAATFDYDIAEVDADAKHNSPLLGNPRLAVEHPTLDFHGATHRLDDAQKLSQEAIAHLVDDMTGMLGDLRVDELAEMRLDALVGSFLVSPHQPRVAHRIDEKDRGKTVFLTRHDKILKASLYGNLPKAAVL
jgi:hypothetical protein